MRSGVEQSRQSNAISMARLAEAEADAAVVGCIGSGQLRPASGGPLSGALAGAGQTRQGWKP